MQIPRSHDPQAGPRGRRSGAHRAPTPLRWRWLLGITLPVAVLTGAGLAVAELPDSQESTTALEPVTDTRTLTDQDEQNESPDSAVVTQPAETPSSEAPSSSSPEPEESGAETENGPVDELAALATDAVALTNQERQNAGCGTVSDNASLAAASTAHSKDMADNDYFDHTSRDGRTFTDRAAAQGYDQAMSENIAKGYPDAAAVVQGWMDSPGHRDNLLNCDAKAVGIGVARDASGALVWTQMFGRQ
ncbi:uncharacterized protein YkwD [Stackebrandtia endophytica]|uniref:Uncharacterized protein YkwD n=1 Tax=Stackebrandtia endophytica TaxID=1496996 RepID=A0A543B1R6_9ACTN|nr:CAP domain-containing protein [Stackebrandtia endophytica]TQL78680.1 uncharacterized protein YkwD [Stackebrandtia endophytica]